MRKALYLLFLPLIAIVAGCGGQQMKKQELAVTPIVAETVNQVITELVNKHGEDYRFRIERGVNQVAQLWRESDGSTDDFSGFCNEKFIASPEELDLVFNKLMVNYEILSGHLMKIKKDLMRPLHLDLGPIHHVDVMFGSYEPGAHIQEDFYTNKIGFMVALNFPFYTLAEKTNLGTNWSRKQWAFARVGDYYTSRVPAELIQQVSTNDTETDNYIAEYNIYMGKLVNNNGETLFPDDLRLITHWGLRDELKSNYADERGLEKQNMIYSVMKRIIDQSIPEKVINNNAYVWNPIENKLYKNDTSLNFTSEPDTRYLRLLNSFKANKNLDPYYPKFPTYIQRQFEANMEIPQKDVEQLFTEFISSPQVKEVATLISERLGRPLEPFDIWYNGFKARGTYTEEQLNEIVKAKYPDVGAFQADLDLILRKLGYDKDKASFLASQVKVESSRGAGHAWGATMRQDKALLRSRIGAGGMDYKGYNIALHEFGHNVEQTISLHDVDYYVLNRVPNTAFTEALAFIFQKRDLEMLGLKDKDPMKEHMLALSNFWSSYEIMGVSLVDIRVWEWMYANPDATPASLKEAVIRIAKEVWDQFYAPVFGMQDEPILAIYSHMITNPLYLSNYPLGHLIDFQIEQHIRDKDFAAETQRMFKQGSIIPQEWMKGAVGMEISILPSLEATTKAVKALRE
ncbi:MAG: hypothetical protein U1C46_07475 [Bacteroidales bacterium]|nr:hypothetical protein [Bacteroidales bacterium]MDZ4204644.1 hypothetical protein [Bacteroidales bacterium]